MINCEQAAERLSERLQRRLGLRRERAIRFHILICAACRHYATQFRWLHEWLRGEPRAEATARLDTAARGRIVARVLRA